tara:strand:- start:102 stop:641 length:540 start_codon:yes stop_codon:yes gene_type:complete
MAKSKLQKAKEEAEISEIKAREELHLANMKADQANRARGFTIGTAFGGTTEISMRGNAGQNLFCLLQPVEVIELIHQLSANVGCHLKLLPRKDFSSWRDWQLTEEELAHYRGNQALPGVGHPPHSNDMAVHHDVGGGVLPATEVQAGVPLQIKEKEKENAVAIKKTVNKRSTKRSRKSS